MIFEFSFDGSTRCYSLGQSDAVLEAHRGLELYKRNQNYGDLRRTFASLSWIISEGNPRNAEVCSATHHLAMSLLGRLTDYQRLFVINSATSAYAKAGLPESAELNFLQARITERVAANFDRQAALDAGLAILNPQTGNCEVQPIPQYSE